MFGENLNERDSPRLPPPANARSWLRAVIASLALHIVIAAALLISAVRQGDPIIRHRPAENSPFAAQIVLMNAVPVPAARNPEPAAPPQPVPPSPVTASALVSSAPVQAAAAASPPSVVPGASPATAPSLAAAPATAGSVPSVDLAALGSDYRRRLLDHIAAHRRTPPAGAALGTVYVRFSLARGGDVQSVTIAVSSGDPALDRVAIESIQNANPMPMIPPAFPDRLSVTLPIDFRRSDQMTVLARP